ncbi:MAG: hypothetical protein M0Z67_11875 [Nitrospiraceae bacterium]|nr:hypothetical protein [Nitrospiraceae bacterium]
MSSGTLSRRHAAWFVVLLLVAVLTAGCAGRPMPVAIQPPFEVPKDSPEAEKKHVQDVIAEIEKRNKEVETDPQWVAKAYSDFMIKSLQDVDESDYGRYGQYLDHGAVYIVVHPAYYTFFHEGGGPNDPLATPSQNAVDLLLREPAYSSKTRLQLAQEKTLRDFLEYMSTDRKLVILVLPRYYKKYEGYKFRRGNDEFMRYINEVTNGSDSVLYLYSKRPNRGTLAGMDRRRLLKFLYSVKAKEILLGGGYIGRCLEDLYKDMEQYYSDDKLYVVPEITSISPSDMSSGAASDVLDADGMVDVGKLSKSIQSNSLGNQEITPRIRNLRVVTGSPVGTK